MSRFPADLTALCETAAGGGEGAGVIHGPPLAAGPGRFNLLCLTGVSQSGKDTLARFLIDNHGYRRYGLADGVRAMAEAIDPTIAIPSGLWSTRPQDPVYLSAAGNIVGCTSLSALVKRFGWDEIKTKLPEVRALLQRIGTEGGREFWGPDCWINRTWRLIEADFLAWRTTAKAHTTFSVVITDVRFANESGGLSQRAAQLVLDRRVESARCRLVRVTRPGYGTVNNHASEQYHALDNFIDATIANDGALSDLAAKAAELAVP